MVRALDLHGYEFESLPYGDFSIFQDGGRRHLGFLIFLIFNGGNGQECRTTLLCQILSKSLKSRSRYRNFGFFKMAAAVILDFKIFTFLTVGDAKKVESLHCVKFRLNRSNPGRHMVIFDFSRWRPPPSWIFEI